MGIDFNGADAHWSYSGFNNFRKRLAKEINIDLERMEGFTKDGSIGIPWENTDAIIPLLDHSDCDGSISSVKCLKIAPRLLELIKDWPDDYDKDQATKLAKGMRTCGKRKKSLEFC